MIPMQKTILPHQGTRAAYKRTSLSPARDLLTRTSWADATLALSQINKGKASGNKAALWLRAWLQRHLFLLGCFIQRNPGKILFVGLLVLSCFCVGLKSATMQTDVEKLWVEEGGRLEKELRYMQSTLGDGAGSTNQILIHTPKEKGANILHVDSLLAHLQVVKAAVQVSVEVFDIPWSLKDLCYSPSFPVFDKHYIDMTLENLFPCAIITPLDCFWEGSKLLGPEIPVKIPGLNVFAQWTNLNPQWLLDTIKNFGNFGSTFNFHAVEAFMKRAGISTAYQEKPCLQPSDEQCPSTASNKENLQPPDVGAELSDGCHGFATKYMHWPEDVLIGGITKNKMGRIVRAEALQTIIQLMAEKEVYEFWQDTFKVHNLDWTMEKARQVLEAWQRKFSEVVLEEAKSVNVTKHHSINAFSTTSLGDIMKDFSEIDVTRVAAGYVAMLIYACLSLMNWSNPIYSQSGIGIAGVLLITLSVGAGLGFCSILGIVFNASTTQVLPFLALGLGMDDMFLIAHQYAEIANVDSNQEPQEPLTGECLKRAGVNVLLTSVSNVCAFCVAAIIPIPALRTFVLQAAILMVFNTGIILLIFPAVVSIDFKRRRAKKIDIFCCFGCSKESHGSEKPYQTGGCSRQYDAHHVAIPMRQAVTHALPPDGSHVVTVLAPSNTQQRSRCWQEAKTPVPSVENLAATNSTSTKELISKKSSNIRDRCIKVCENTKKECFNWSLEWFVNEQLAPTLLKTSVKVMTVVSFVIIMCISVWGVFQVKDGLDLTDIVPRKTNEYEFLDKQSKYFGFFNMFAVTQGNFEYPNNQRLLYEYHDAFMRIDKIIKNDDGGLPEFWLSMFRDWLLGLQKAFDDDWQDGCIMQEGWFPNATDDGILAYKLLVQTGRIDNPIDKSLVSKGRLVDKNRIINTKAFYNFLTAWVSNDALAYSASQANLRPEPRKWIHDPQDVELKIPKSQPLAYAQIPFYLNRLGSTEQITETIEAIRAVCKKFEEKSLPNFPTGIPFTYWEQYIGLRYYLLLALLCIFAVIFLVMTTVLVNPWAAFVVVFLLAVIVIELFGVMGILGVKLSAVPAVILISSVGFGVEFAAHIMMGFLTSIGKKDRRMVMTLEHMFSPVMHGAISTLIGVVLLAFSEFDFIIRYFFYILFALVVIGVLNGLVLFPILLSIIGPPGEVVPHDDPDRIPTPSPEPSPIRHRIHHARPFSKRIYPRVNSEISLSTITEESSSCHSSHEIVVQPELVVETTTITNTTAGQTTVSSTTTGVPEASDSPTDESSSRKSPGGDSNSSTSTTTTNTSAKLNNQSSAACESPCQPEVVVETTTTTNTTSGPIGSFQEASSSYSDTGAIPCHHSASPVFNTATGIVGQPPTTTQTAVTTRVTATAKVKVHAPLTGSLDRCMESNKHRRRRDTCCSSCNCSYNRSSLRIPSPNS